MRIVTWSQLSADQRQDILSRPGCRENVHEITAIVNDILRQVKEQGDSALYQLTEQLDGAQLEQLQLPKASLTQAKSYLSEEDSTALELAYTRIYHHQQRLLSQPVTIDNGDGVQCQVLNRPIERVGLYVPGGQAPLVSSLLMSAVPARVAGCPEIVLCTPPDADGKISPILIEAAKRCGIDQIFRIGGAQAVAAMAYGTQTVPRVQRIFGPGNIWVDHAKQIVSQDPFGASIDLPAGPSEVLVIADDSAEPQWVAADLLAQAEHGPDSQVILLTDSSELAANVQTACQQQQRQLNQPDTIDQSLRHARLIVCENIDRAVQISNDYAPEHLILQLTDAQYYLSLVTNAGTVFMGHWAPETMGDYITGSNHILPTGGNAKAYSGVSVTDFMRRMPVQYITTDGMKNLGPTAGQIASMEGLSAHKRAVDYRLDMMANKGGDECDI